MLSLRARPKTFHNPQLRRGRQHPQQRGRKFPQHSARPYTGSYVAGRTTEQTQWFRFESCWSPPLGTASRPPNSSLPAHPTGVEPRLEPGEFFTRKRAASLARLGSSEPKFRKVLTMPMHGKGALEVSLACLTRPNYVQGHREKALRA